MTVHVVTSGGHSDYGIDSIFSTREKAETFINGSPYMFVEEYELDADHGVRRSIPCWRARIEVESGNLAEGPDGHETVALTNRRECKVSEPTMDQVVASRRYTYFRQAINVTSYVSQEHANKVAVEKRQEWLRKHGPPPAEGVSS